MQRAPGCCQGPAATRPTAACCCPAEMSPDTAPYCGYRDGTCGLDSAEASLPSQLAEAGIISDPSIGYCVDAVNPAGEPQPGSCAVGACWRLQRCQMHGPRADGRSFGCCVPRHATTPPHPLMRPLPTPPGKQAPCWSWGPLRLPDSLPLQSSPLQSGANQTSAQTGYWVELESVTIGGGETVEVGQGALRCIAIDTMQPACCLAALPAAHPALPGSSPAAAAATPCPPQAVGHSGPARQWHTHA